MIVSSPLDRTRRIGTGLAFIIFPLVFVGIFISSAFFPTGLMKGWYQSVAEVNPITLMNENKGVFGVNLGHMWGEVDRIRTWMDELLAKWERGVVQPVIAERFPFERAAEAHHYIQDRRNLGKVLLVPH